MSDKEELKNLFQFYADSEEGVVKLPFGEENSDLKELFEAADFFAERYGLGGCRSLDEFVEMINNTDPATLNMLKAVAIEKNKAELDEIESSGKAKGGAKDVPSPKIGKTALSRPHTTRGTPVRVKGGNTSMSRANMKRFLTSFGAGQEDLEKACVRLDGRKIEFKDYGWVDKYSLKNMSSEDFREVLHSMSKDIKESENFEVSDETLRARFRKEVESCRKSKST